VSSWYRTGIALALKKGGEKRQGKCSEEYNQHAFENPQVAFLFR
jgi:hypothetical protein